MVTATQAEPSLQERRRKSLFNYALFHGALHAHAMTGHGSLRRLSAFVVAVVVQFCFHVDFEFLVQ